MANSQQNPRKKKDQVIHIDPKLHKDFKIFVLMQDSNITTEAEKALVNHMHYGKAERKNT